VLSSSHGMLIPLEEKGHFEDSLKSIYLLEVARDSMIHDIYEYQEYGT